MVRSHVQCPGLITVKEADERGFFEVTPRRMKVPSVASDENQVLFECKEPGCSYVFATYDELQDHTNFGEHGLNLQPQESIYDHLRHQWAFKFSTLSLADESKEKQQPVEKEGSAPTEDWKFGSEGWALQKPRGGSVRFSEKVKSFLKDRFHAGVQTGRKADPAQVVADMRKFRNSDGTRKFSRVEWLTKGQVQSFLAGSRHLAEKLAEQSKAIWLRKMVITLATTMMTVICHWRKSRSILMRGAETRKLMISVTNWVWSTPSCMMGMTCVSRSGLTNSLNLPYQH